MWTEYILKKFNLKTAGEADDDEEEDDDGEKGGQGGDGSGNQDDDGDDDGSGDDDLTPEEYKKQIAKLRKENAKNRLKNKGLDEKMGKFEKMFKAFSGDDGDDDPEKQLDTMTQSYESAITRNAVLELAFENGVSGSENLEYFEFLMGKTLDSLDEGEEMSEEQLEEILTKCSSKGGAGKGASTSTDDAGKGGKKKPGKEGDDEVTQEEFSKMGIMQKSALYQKNSALYEKLMKNSTER